MIQMIDDMKDDIFNMKKQISVSKHTCGRCQKKYSLNTNEAAAMD